MRFSPSFLDEIRARLPVSEVVRQRVKLQRAGREWKGLSPFNTEKSPSFFVNDQKGFYHDFSSGNHGDIFDFLMATEGLTFPEAAERLAALAGVTLPKATPEDAEREKKRAGLHEVLEWAAAFFESALAGREGVRARGYLCDRGIGPAVQKEFRLGLAPGTAGGGSDERYALRDHLAGKGATRETMIEAGLLIHGDDIAVPYDRFRGRVMFPIEDRNGRVIAFGGRALDKDVPAKYLNSPETPLFHKGAVLYNHHRARKAAHDKGTVIVAEGYVDVIALTSAGLPHCVAPLGTALTPDQLDLVWRMAEEPVLCFDGDNAGRKAAGRAVDTALPSIGDGRTLRFAILPEGKDPDDLVRSEGPAAMAAVIHAATPLSDFLWTRELERGPMDTPEHRAAFERRLGEAVRQIADVSLRRHYQEEMGARLATLLGRTGGSGQQGRNQNRGGQAWNGQAWNGQAWNGKDWQNRGAAGAGGRAGFGRFGGPKLGFASRAPMASTGLKQSALMTRGRLPTREVHILGVVLNHPELLRRHAEDLASLEFETRELEVLRDALLGFPLDEIEDHAGLKAAVDAVGLSQTRSRVEAAAASLSLWCAGPDASELDADAGLVQALTLQRKSRSLHRELDLAVVDYGERQDETSLARLTFLRAEISDVEGSEASLEGFGALSGRADSHM